MVVISNAFSINMLPAWRKDAAKPVATPLRIEPIALDKLKEFLTIVAASGRQIQSAVGHADTAAVFSEQLGLKVEPNRVSVTLQTDMTLVVGQYNGPRLPEGATTLPEGATITWFVVEVID